MPSEGPLCQREGYLTRTMLVRKLIHFLTSTYGRIFPQKRTFAFLQILLTSNYSEQTRVPHHYLSTRNHHPSLPLFSSSHPFFVRHPFAYDCVRAPDGGRKGISPSPSLSLSSIFPTHRSLSTVQSEGREESTNIAEPRSRELSPSPSSTTYPQSSSPPSLTTKATRCQSMRGSPQSAPPSGRLRQRREREAAECVGDVGRSPVCLGRPPSRAERGAARRRRLRCWRRRCLTTKNSGAMDNAARA